jgi:hypothetical protein
LITPVEGRAGSLSRPGPVPGREVWPVCLHPSHCLFRGRANGRGPPAVPCAITRTASCAAAWPRSARAAGTNRCC